MEAFEIIIPKSPKANFIIVGSEGKNKYLSKPSHWKCSIGNDQSGARLDYILWKEVYSYLLIHFLKMWSNVFCILHHTRFRVELLETNMKVYKVFISKKV